MKCVITNKKTRVGNCVSKSNRKTKRKFKVNLQKHRFYVGCKFISCKVSCKGLGIIKKLGFQKALLYKKHLG